VWSLIRLDEPGQEREERPDAEADPDNDGAQQDDDQEASGEGFALGGELEGHGYGGGSGMRAAVWDSPAQRSALSARPFARDVAHHRLERPHRHEVFGRATRDESGAVAPAPEAGRQELDAVPGQAGEREPGEPPPLGKEAPLAGMFRSPRAGRKRKLVVAGIGDFPTSVSGALQGTPARCGWRGATSFAMGQATSRSHSVKPPQ